ncbi:protein-export chaperone SecB [Aquimonas sp.]|jgi:preprotein translocase subunit SecB|uniref:protein-export chaperone SecB n=1 Tax=Aquimonas sp. TaxID=1872588 RepID=UPI0037BE52B8
MSEENQSAANGAAPDQAQAQLVLQKIYVKDASFEAPSAPQIFQEEMSPQLQLNMNQKVTGLAQDVYEVVLTLTLTCTAGDKTAYLVEAQQAGVFTISGFDARNLDAVLGTYCPNTLFPYARQLISDLIQAGGFPPYFLQPINFDQLYADTLRRRAEQGPVDQLSGETAGNA